MVNPTIGNGGGAAALYATRLGNDDVSPPSSLGAAGFVTERGSWAVGLGARLYLHQDRYRVTLAGGGGVFNYNFFGIGTAAGEADISIPLSQQSKAFLIEPKIRIFPHWYLGPRYHLITNKISLAPGNFDPAHPPIPLPADTSFTTAALGIRFQRDSSDSPFYPRKGSILDLTTDFFGPAVGGDRTYQSLTLTYDKYLSFGNKNVFAIHGSMCAASDKAPFFDLCLLGLSSDLRGYQIGQYRDNRMFVGQAEFRRELFWRIGAVAFAGAGAVGSSFTNFGNPEPGGGVGLRFLLARRNHINLRADYAWGNNSHASYVSIGEAF
jgi:outer membrane protein assembly factor BamA